MTTPIPTGLIRCDVGGNAQTFEFPDGPAQLVYEPPCGGTPTHRYRSKPGPNVDPASAWGHRCADHVGWLDTNHVEVESLEGASSRRPEQETAGAS